MQKNPGLEKCTQEPGTLADFVVLVGNPLRVPLAKLQDIAIEETIVGGRSVFRRQ